VLALREHPRERDLGGCDAAAIRDGAHGVHDPLVRCDRLGREAGETRPEVASRETGLRRELARQEPAPEGRERHERCAVGGAPGHDVVEILARPERQLRLHGSDRVDARHALEVGYLRFRYPEPAHLAFGNEPRHSSPGVLDGCGGIDAVEVVEIDDVDLQPRQRALARRADVLGTAVAAVAVSRRRALHEETGLRRNDDLLARSPDRAADEDLVGVRTVSIRRVEVVDAELDRALDEPHALRLLDGLLVVRPREAHAAEADGVNEAGGFAEWAFGHEVCFHCSCYPASLSSRIVPVIPRSGATRDPVLDKRGIPRCARDDLARDSARQVT
jgi:hypothetical protein